MKSRLTHWPSTLLGVACLAFLGFLAWLNPALRSDPQALLFIAAGLFGLFYRRKAA
jgi:hypothetical protein